MIAEFRDKFPQLFSVLAAIFSLENILALIIALILIAIYITLRLMLRSGFIRDSNDHTRNSHSDCCLSDAGIRLPPYQVG